MNLYFAIITYNRFNYLKECVETWDGTKNNTYNWTLLIADNGSTDGTIPWCETLNVKLIHNERKGVHYQTNSIFREINKSDFDICFVVNDDMSFLKSGWDDLYVEAIKDSGYDHLVFHHDSRKKKFIDKPIRKGKLEANTDWVHALGCFCTITQEILDKVGYYDIAHFGPHESAHIDYTYRCCRCGFNELPYPYDAADSNAYIHLKWQHNDPSYRHSMPEKERDTRRSKLDPLINKQKYLDFRKDTIYVPYGNLTL